jgi:hypothetical protein
MSLLVRTSTDAGALLVQDTDDPFALAVTESTSPLALRVRESTSPLAMRVRGLFSPASLPGLAAWYDASDSNTVLTTVSPDVPATDGQTVRRWLDKSGNNRHLEQTDLTLQPIFTDAATGLTFDGNNDRMQAVGFILVKPFTVFAAFRWVGSGNLRVFDASDTSRHRLDSSAAGNLAFIDGAATSSPTVVPTTTSSLGVFVFSQTAARGKINSTDVTATGLNATGMNGITAGASSAFAQFHNGQIMEMGFIQADVGNANLEKLESYLRKRWGITA